MNYKALMQAMAAPDIAVKLLRRWHSHDPTRRRTQGKVRTRGAGLKDLRLVRADPETKIGDWQIDKAHKNTMCSKRMSSKPETAMDKTTTRVVRQMVDEDAEQRRAKITRLRNARLEREANTPPETKASSSIQIAPQESRFDVVVEPAFFALDTLPGDRQFNRF